MIELKRKKSGDDGHPKKVSIRESTDQTDIMLRLAKAFAPLMVGPNNQPNGNSFPDYVFDWYERNWGFPAAIQINGFAELLVRDPEFAMFLVLTFGRQEVGIVEWQTRQNPDALILHELGKLRIILA